MPGAIVGFLVSSAVTSAIGTAGGLILGVSVGQIVGGLAGAIVGGAVDRALAPSSPDPISASTPDARVEATPVIEATEPVQVNATERVQAAGRLVTVRQPISPWQWIYGSARVGGDLTFVHASSDGQYLDLVITLAGHISYDIGDAGSGSFSLWFDDEVVPFFSNGQASGRHAGAVVVKLSTGEEAGQPFPDLVAGSEGAWTDAHRQSGRTKIWVRLSNDPDLFPTGIPNITAVVAGREVYDPRLGVSAWSQNPALCAADYFVNVVGVDYATQIDEDLLIAAANACDETIVVAAGGTETRYNCNGAFRVSEQPKGVLERLLGAMAGWAVKVGGQWRIYAGVYEAPTLTLTESDLAGPMRIQSLVSRRDNANGVKGVFVDPTQSWQPTDFPPIAPAAYLAQDNDERVWKDLDFTGFITTAATAQRLAKIELLRLRQGLTVSATYKLTAFRAMTGRSVAITDTQMGWSSKVFEVLGSSFVVAGDGTLGVRLDMRETAAAIYDWSVTEELLIDPAPNTNLPDPFTAYPPNNILLSSGTDELLVTGDGTVLSRIKVAWDAHTDGMVSGKGYILAQFKKSADTIWLDASPAAGNATALWLAPVDDGVAYDVRVRAQNVIGVRSSWVQPPAHTVIGKTALPSDVESFTIEGANLYWSTVADRDLAGYRVRFQPGNNRSWGDAVALHAGLLTHSPFAMTALPSGQVTLSIKAVDTTGNESEDAAYIVTDFGDPVVANIVETFDLKAAGFTGTKTNGTVTGGDLVADATTLMWNADDQANMWSGDSTVLMWAAAIYAQMRYEDRIVVTEALAGSALTITATVVGVPWYIEYRENSARLMWSVDTTTLMWSADDATLMWDTPDYQTWPGSIVVKNSMYDFRVTTGQGSTQGEISELTLTIDAPDVSESLNDVVIAASGTRLPITQDYASIKVVNLTLQNDGGTAIKPQIEDKDAALGPLVKCYDAANVATGGKVDALIQGY